MYKGYICQNDINHKSFLKDSIEEEIQNPFPFSFSKKESIDDIKFENRLYFHDNKFNDITKNSTNDIFEGKDLNIHKIDNKLNKNKLSQLKKENQISINFINATNENSLSHTNKSIEQNDIA
jgi:hypothetical protein